MKEPNLMPKPVTVTISKRAVKPVAKSDPAVAMSPY
jgi:formaldehyde-activating enzyme involved in methanogenesis